MHIIFDDDFEEFCFRKYQNYLLGAEALGITDVGDFGATRLGTLKVLKQNITKVQTEFCTDFKGACYGFF